MIIIGKVQEINILLKHYSNAKFISLTENGITEFRKLAPSYKWGNIRVPYSPGLYAESVNDVLEKLRLAKNEIAYGDKASYSNHIFENKVLYRRGIDGDYIYDELEARKYIYIPTYRWMLENKANHLIDKLRAYKGDMVFLDENLNFDINDTSKPLSHAFLVKAYVEGTAPYEDSVEIIKYFKYYMVGRREIVKETNEKVYRSNLCINPHPQSEIEFDYEY